jgi:hypothetical protein
MQHKLGQLKVSDLRAANDDMGDSEAESRSTGYYVARRHIVCV